MLFQRNVEIVLDVYGRQIVGNVLIVLLSNSLVLKGFVFRLVNFRLLRQLYLFQQDMYQEKEKFVTL